MSNDVFDPKLLSEKLSKINNSQQSIECTNYRLQLRNRNKLLNCNIYYVSHGLKEVISQLGLLLTAPILFVEYLLWRQLISRGVSRTGKKSALSQLCISHRKKARQIVETWEKMFYLSQKEQCISFLHLANDVLQNSRRKGSEYVNEFWKVLPAALKHVCNAGDSGKKAASRLVGIWEERKVFGSRIQSLKDELVAIQTKDPSPQVVSNGKSNPIKLVKKDGQSLRIKLAVGGFPEKIVSAFHGLHDECSDEESMLVNCNAAVFSVEQMMTEVEKTISQGIQPRAGMAGEMLEQENVLQKCVRQLEGAEATRVSLVSLLKEAIQDQEVHLETLRRQLQIARSRINDMGTLKPKLSSLDRGASAIATRVMTEPAMMGELNNPGVQATSNIQIHPSQPFSNQPIPVQVPPTSSQHATTTFTALSATDEESKKAAAAAVAAKLTASTSSAQMFSSVLSSLVAEEAAKVGFSSTLPMFSPDKRQKLEHQSSGADAANLDAGSSSYFTAISNNPVSQPSIQAGSLGPPPPPPPLLPASQLPNQFTQSAGMMLNMMPYGFGGNTLPPPPPLQSHVAMGLARPPTPQSSQPLQPPQQLMQQQNASGGFYRPPGIGLYGSSSQPSTPPVQRQ